jgi:uncharacterized protein (DUF433 family)
MKYLAAQFPRLTYDTSVLGGEIRIRDLDITVHEIVRLATSGTSEADILQQFPQLEAEDIHQALVYSIRELSEVIGIWKNEALTPLTGIRAYSEILLGKHQIAITEELRQQSYQLFFRNSLRAISCWWNLGDWVNFRFRRHDTHRITSPFAQVIETLLRDISKPGFETTLHVDVTENLPSVKANQYLEDAIQILVSDTAFSYLKPQATLTAQVSDSKYLAIQISRPYENESIDTPTMNHLFSTGTPFNLANSVLQEHQCKLDVQIDNTEVIFTVQLPIANENPEE